MSFVFISIYSCFCSNPVSHLVASIEPGGKDSLLDSPRFIVVRSVLLAF